MFCFAQICRICINNCENLTHLTRRTKFDIDITYSDMLHDIYPKISSMDHNLPEFICQKCGKALETAYLFKKKCSQSLIKFDNYLKLLNTKNNRESELLIGYNSETSRDIFFKIVQEKNLEHSVLEQKHLVEKSIEIIPSSSKSKTWSSKPETDDLELASLSSHGTSSVSTVLLLQKQLELEILELELLESDSLDSESDDNSSSKTGDNSSTNESTNNCDITCSKIIGSNNDPETNEAQIKQEIINNYLEQNTDGHVKEDNSLRVLNSRTEEEIQRFIAANSYKISLNDHILETTDKRPRLEMFRNTEDTSEIVKEEKCLTTAEIETGPVGNCLQTAGVQEGSNPKNERFMDILNATEEELRKYIENNSYKISLSDINKYCSSKTTEDKQSTIVEETKENIIKTRRSSTNSETCSNRASSALSSISINHSDIDSSDFVFSDFYNIDRIEPNILQNFEKEQNFKLELDITDETVLDYTDLDLVTLKQEKYIDPYVKTTEHSYKTNESKNIKLHSLEPTINLETSFVNNMNFTDNLELKQTNKNPISISCDTTEPSSATKTTNTSLYSGSKPAIFQNNSGSKIISTNTDAQQKIDTSFSSSSKNTKKSTHSNLNTQSCATQTSGSKPENCQNNSGSKTVLTNTNAQQKTNTSFSSCSKNTKKSTHSNLNTQSSATQTSGSKSENGQTNSGTKTVITNTVAQQKINTTLSSSTKKSADSNLNTQSSATQTSGSKPRNCEITSGTKTVLTNTAAQLKTNTTLSSSTKKSADSNLNTQSSATQTSGSKPRNCEITSGTKTVLTNTAAQQKTNTTLSSSTKKSADSNLNTQSSATQTSSSKLENCQNNSGTKTVSTNTAAQQKTNTTLSGSPTNTKKSTDSNLNTQSSATQTSSPKPANCQMDSGSKTVSLDNTEKIEVLLQDLEKKLFETSDNPSKKSLESSDSKTVDSSPETKAIETSTEVLKQTEQKSAKNNLSINVNSIEYVPAVTKRSASDSPKTKEGSLNDTAGSSDPKKLKINSELTTENVKPSTSISGTKDASNTTRSPQNDDVTPYNSLCHICNVRCESIRQLNHHLRSKHFSKCFQCKFCPQTFKLVNNYNNHLYMHIRANRYDPSFNIPPEFNSIRSRINRCEPNTYNNNIGINERLRTAGLPPKCRNCGACFRNYFAFKYHISQCNIY